MSDIEPEYDENPGPSHYWRDDGWREDVRSRAVDPANSPEGVQAQAADEEWQEHDFPLEEPENDGQSETDQESDDDEWRHRPRRSQRNVPRPNYAEPNPYPGSRRRRRVRRSNNNPGLRQVEGAGGLEYPQPRPTGIGQEFFVLGMSIRTRSVLKGLENTSLAVTDESDCNFLTQPWEIEENKNSAEKCIQEYKDPDLDAKYYNELVKKKKYPAYKKMCAFREKLPAHKMQDEIVKLIHENQVCFIQGGTGCGKTTQIVQFVLDNYIMNMNGSVCNIVCAQPRRISASSVAERIARERLEPLSRSVGYQIRFEKKSAERKVGCINFVTTGVLLQWLVTNWPLPQISHVFLDEVHEKTIEYESVMTLLKMVIQERRDLKIILMSATIDCDSFCKYFDGAPSLNIPGYTFPVEDFYLPDILEMTDYKVSKPEKIRVPNYNPDPEDLEEDFWDFPCPQNLVHGTSFRIPQEIDIHLVAHLIGYICVNEEDGAILVFLPGLADIIRVMKNIKSSPWYNSEKHILTAAHSLLPEKGQGDVFVIPPKGKRKIILATSIMETSITLEDMTYVVDCGRIKFSSFNENLKLSTLDATWITRANAMQRRGRVGRTKPGKCYKLYTKDQEDNFVPYPPTDMQLSTLERVILDLKILKIQKVGSFLERLMDPPPPVLVELALKELRKMSALDDNEQLTALGYHLSKLPLDVRTGKMIIMGACFSCIDPIFSIAACLSYKDPFNITLDEDKAMSVKGRYSIWESSDHVIFSEIVRDWENGNFTDKHQFCSEKYLSESKLNQISEAKKQFAETLHSMNLLPSADVKDPASNVNSNRVHIVKAIICAGLYPNVATLTRGTRSTGVITLEGQFAEFHGKSVLSEYPSYYLPFFAYFFILRTATKTFIHDATMIEILPLLLFSEGFEIITIGRRTFVRVDDNLVFKMGPKSAELLQRTRNRLNQVLGRAFLKSECFNWSQGGNGVALLNVIVSLFHGHELKQEARCAF